MLTNNNPVRATPAAYRDGNVLRWFVAYTFSLVGDSGYFLALGWAANQVAGPSQVGLVMAVGAVPRAILMLGGGVVADRFGPRIIVLGSDALRCLVILTVAAVLALSSPGLWLLLTVALVFGVVDAFFLPAVGSLPPLIADPSQLVRVQGMRALAIRLGTTAGPPIAGLAMGFGGPAAAFAIAGTVFAASFVLLLGVRINSPTPAGINDQEPRKGAWGDFVDGLRYVRGRRLIATIIIAMTFVEIGCVAPLNVGLLLLADENEWGSSGAGWLIGAFGVGSSASALLITVLGRIPAEKTVYLATLGLGSAGIASVAFAPSLPMAVSACALTGVTLGLNGALASSFVQRVTQARFLGRVMSLLGFTSFALGPMTFPVFGVAVSAFGTRPVFSVCGAISLCGVIVASLSPDFRTKNLSDVPRRP